MNKKKLFNAFNLKKIINDLIQNSFYTKKEAKLEAKDIVYGKRSHKSLLKIVKKLPEDFEPWGKVTEEERYNNKKAWGDCSCGCRYYIPLEHHGADWGVCVNPKSHRCGLLTFEHQGCLKYGGLK